MNTIQFSALPPLGAELAGGKFAGITTQKDGTHAAAILLPNKGHELTWKTAIAWAKKIKAELPSRSVAALIITNVKSELDPSWHWTIDEYDASDAWGCFFNYGRQDYHHKSYEGSAVAVRLIPIKEST